MDIGYPYICPVCRGKGVIENEYGILVKCHGCGGKGWVEVNIRIFNPVPNYLPQKKPDRDSANKPHWNSPNGYKYFRC